MPVPRLRDKCLIKVQASRSDGQPRPIGQRFTRLIILRVYFQRLTKVPCRIHGVSTRSQDKAEIKASFLGSPHRTFDPFSVPTLSFVELAGERVRCTEVDVLACIIRPKLDYFAIPCHG